MVKDALTRWPFIRQILSGGDGTGVEAMSVRTRSLRPRHEGAEGTRSWRGLNVKSSRQFLVY